MTFTPPSTEFSSPAVISKPPKDDDDIFSTLLMYEKEVRAEKREKKHFERKKKELGLDGGVSMLKSAAPVVPPAMSLDIPRSSS